MANSLNNNPIILDTAGATSILDRQVCLSSAIFSDYDTGATLVLTNANGTREILNWTMGQKDHPYDPHFDGGLNIPDGIAVKTISSGVLFLYEERS